MNLTSWSPGFACGECHGVSQQTSCVSKSHVWFLKGNHLLQRCLECNLPPLPKPMVGGTKGTTSSGRRTARFNSTRTMALGVGTRASRRSKIWWKSFRPSFSSSWLFSIWIIGNLGLFKRKAYKKTFVFLLQWNLGFPDCFQWMKPGSQEIGGQMFSVFDGIPSTWFVCHFGNP